MSAEADLLGTPRQFTFEGTAYPIGMITGKVRTEYERKLADRALQRLQKQKPQFTKKQYLEELRFLGEREDRGDFSIYNSKSSIITAWGQETLLKLLMPTCPADVLARMLDDKYDEILWLLDRVISDSMPTSTKKSAEEQGRPFEDGEARSPAPTSATGS